MIRDALFIARRDLRMVLRARETLVWVFVMPIVFFYFIGTVTGGFAPPKTGRKDAIELRVGPDAGFLVDELTRQLEVQNYRVVAPDTAVAYSRVLTVPAAFTDSVLAGVPQTVRFEFGRDGIGADYEKIRVGRAAYTVLADLVAARRLAPDSAAAARVGPEQFAELAALPRALSLRVDTAGQRREIPTGFSQAVPGILVMFLLLVMATSGAVLLVIERRQGLLRRLASTPIDRRSVVFGKWGGRLVLGWIQIAFAMLAGTLLFQMNWGGDLAWVLLVLIVYAALMAGVGLLLGTLARTEGQAVGIGVVSANVLGALGGCWWPIEVAPAWMQKLQLFLPTGWAMDALHHLIAFEAGPASVIPHLLGMALATLLVLLWTSRAFRYE
ncbi:MAG: hypothetical protein DHS20C21_06220 [Gemmatimonadota bacterium]|nr:MAG: hypothetical protein DHS20C21_06220 [Gemmatimonadota bacterium]